MINTEKRNALWEEFRGYTDENSMTRYERSLLRDWVRSGHSVYETVEPRYLPEPSYPPMDFLQAYRFDRELREDMKGMTQEEQNAYLKAYMGLEDQAPEEMDRKKAKECTPDPVSYHVRRLERELYSLWRYVWQEGLGEEAEEFVEQRRDEPIPFEW